MTTHDRIPDTWTVFSATLTSAEVLAQLNTELAERTELRRRGEEIPERVELWASARRIVVQNTATYENAEADIKATMTIFLAALRVYDFFHTDVEAIRVLGNTLGRWLMSDHSLMSVKYDGFRVLLGDPSLTGWEVGRIRNYIVMPHLRYVNTGSVLLLQLAADDVVFDWASVLPDAYQLVRNYEPTSVNYTGLCGFTPATHRLTAKRILECWHAYTYRGTMDFPVRDVLLGTLVTTRRLAAMAGMPEPLGKGMLACRFRLLEPVWQRRVLYLVIALTNVPLAVPEVVLQMLVDYLSELWWRELLATEPKPDPTPGRA